MQNFKRKNHTSHFALHTLQTGITLIALIITIIVMLILVGVTINVALNGGLFTKASQASKQMQVEADRETLLSAVVAAIGYDGKVVLADIELPTGWTGSNGTYKSPKGNTFTVTEDGKITYTGENTGGEQDDPLAKGELTYGKVYSGTRTTRFPDIDVQEFKIAFSEKYNKALISIKDDNGTGFVDFSYNKEAKTVTLQDDNLYWGGIVLNLSEDGENLGCNIDDGNGNVYHSINTTLTDEGPSIKYVANKHSDVNIYNGWYYNESLDTYIYIYCFNASEHNIVWICCFDECEEETGKSKTMAALLESLTTKFGITIIDEDTISRDGYTYELTEILEI